MLANLVGNATGGLAGRSEATGYGNVYFLLQMLKTRNIDIKDKVVCVSGSGNVAQYTVEKLISLGAKVVTMSDSDGYIYDPDGIDREKLDYIMELKNLYRGRIREYAEQYGCKYVQGARPWGEKCDIAMPSATQNELNGDDAKTLLANGCFAVSEGPPERILGNPVPPRHRRIGLRTAQQSQSQAGFSGLVQEQKV